MWPAPPPGPLEEKPEKVRDRRNLRAPSLLYSLNGARKRPNKETETMTKLIDAAFAKAFASLTFA
ncbi:hypothetical protein ABI59_16045 [Acidobacteria bacterium Mor1]|nr:hypothetical protein ABI59_16045 [Acidobacteria bacterium Mor1]